MLGGSSFFPPLSGQMGGRLWRGAAQLVSQARPEQDHLRINTPVGGRTHSGHFRSTHTQESVLSGPGIPLGGGHSANRLSLKHLTASCREGEARLPCHLHAGPDPPSPPLFSKEAERTAARLSVLCQPQSPCSGPGTPQPGHACVLCERGGPVPTQQR